MSMEQSEEVLERCVELDMEGDLDGLEDIMRRNEPLRPMILRRMEGIRKLKGLFMKASGTEAPAPPAADAPAMMQDFDIISLLGAGSMGRVYLARQKGLDRLVALKVLQGGRVLPESALNRFSEEGRILAKLNHPNIVTVHTVGRDPLEGAYIAMQYVPGLPMSEVISFLAGKGVRAVSSEETLEHIRARSRNREERATAGGEPEPGRAVPFMELAIDAMRQIAEALKAAHAQNLVHRDIKPSNILMTPQGRAVLLDFGLTQDLDHARLTMTGEVMGTPLYLPPECLGSDPRRADMRSDVYSFGVTFYEFMTGRPPFRAKSLGGLLRAITKSAPPRPRVLNPSLPRGIEDILLKCLEKRPANRYENGGALAQDMALFARGGTPLAGEAPRKKIAFRAGIAASLLAAAFGVSLTGLPMLPMGQREREVAELRTNRPEPAPPKGTGRPASPIGRQVLPRPRGAPTVPPPAAGSLSPETLLGLEEKPATFYVHKDSGGLFAMDYPSEWNKKEDPNTRSVFFNLSGQNAFFGVRRYEVRETDMERFAAEVYAKVPGKVEILSTRRSEHPHPSLFHIIRIEQHGKKVKGPALFISKGGSVYFLNGYCNEKQFETMEGSFNEMMESFRFLQAG